MTSVSTSSRAGTSRKGLLGDCNWERLDAVGEIIDDNSFINAATQAEVTISPSDFSFNSERSGSWKRIR